MSLTKRAALVALLPRCYDEPLGRLAGDLRLRATRPEYGAQVRRDHAISHILAALRRCSRDELILCGGIAPSRAYLLDEKRSEGIDLIVVDHSDDLADFLPREINAALARTHGRIQRDCEPADDGTLSRPARRAALRCGRR